MKLKEIYFIKGVAIVGVIIIHSYVIDKSNLFFYWTNQFLGQLTRSSVPIFFIVSGILASYSFKTRTLDLKSYWKKRFLKTVIPFISWSIFYYLFIENIKTIYGSGYPIKTFLLGYIHLYYLVVSFQFYLLFPLIRELLKRINHYFMLLMALGVNCTLYIFGVTAKENVMVWIFYLILGCIIGLRYDQIFLRVKKVNMSVFLLLWITTLSAVIADFYINNHSSAMRMVIIPYSVASFFFLLKLGSHECKMQYIGQNSFGIYLIHLFPIMILRNWPIMNKVPWSLALVVPITFVSSLLSVGVFKSFPLTKRLVGDWGVPNE